MAGQRPRWGVKMSPSLACCLPRGLEASLPEAAEGVRGGEGAKPWQKITPLGPGAAQTPLCQASQGGAGAVTLSGPHRKPQMCVWGRQGFGEARRAADTDLSESCHAGVGRRGEKGCHLAPLCRGPGMLRAGPQVPSPERSFLFVSFYRNVLLSA